MSNEQQYEIFRNDNGKLLSKIYGRDNAALNAQGWANNLDTKIGMCQGEGETRYFWPTRAQAWIRKQRLIENAEHLLDVLQRIVSDLEGDDTTVADVNRQDAISIIWHITKGY